jgi:hypothetical protein
MTGQRKEAPALPGLVAALGGPGRQQTSQEYGPTGTKISEAGREGRREGGEG